MRYILALSLLFALSASADAATRHRRHVAVSPTQLFTPNVRSGFAYAPDAPVVRQVPYPGQYNDQPSPYDNRYPNWGG